MAPARWATGALADAFGCESAQGSQDQGRAQTLYEGMARTQGVDRLCLYPIDLLSGYTLLYGQRRGVREDDLKT